jgi:hypothetical protein
MEHWRRRHWHVGVDVVPELGHPAFFKNEFDCAHVALSSSAVAGGGATRLERNRSVFFLASELGLLKRSVLLESCRAGDTARDSCRRRGEGPHQQTLSVQTFPKRFDPALADNRDYHWFFLATLRRTGSTRAVLFEGYVSGHS